MEVTPIVGLYTRRQKFETKLQVIQIEQKTAIKIDKGKKLVSLMLIDKIGIIVANVSYLKFHIYESPSIRITRKTILT